VRVKLCPICRHNFTFSEKFVKHLHHRSQAAVGPQALVENPHLWNTGMVDMDGEAGALLSTKQTAKILGVSDASVRMLIRQGRIDCVRIGKRPWVRRDRIQYFLDSNTEKQCHGETQVPSFGFSKSGDASTSSGLTAGAAASAARALQTANKLSKHSQNSSKTASDTPGRVIRLKSS
jgi:excisionase family DNA binding protein